MPGGRLGRPAGRRNWRRATLLMRQSRLITAPYLQVINSHMRTRPMFIASWWGQDDYGLGFDVFIWVFFVFSFFNHFISD